MPANATLGFHRESRATVEPVTIGRVASEAQPACSRASGEPTSIPRRGIGLFNRPDFRSVSRNELYRPHGCAQVRIYISFLLDYGN